MHVIDRGPNEYSEAPFTDIPRFLPNSGLNSPFERDIRAATPPLTPPPLDLRSWPRGDRYQIPYPGELMTPPAGRQEPSSAGAVYDRRNWQSLHQSVSLKATEEFPIFSAKRNSLRHFASDGGTDPSAQQISWEGRSSTLRGNEGTAWGSVKERASNNSQSDEWQTQFFRTKLCPYHLQRRCINGSNCRFAHCLEDIRPLPDLHRTKLCESYVRRVPCLDFECPFAHDPSELRTSSHSFYKVTLCNFYRKGRCWNGAHCRFAHGAAELQRNQAPRLRRRNFSTPKTASSREGAESTLSFVSTASTLREPTLLQLNQGRYPTAADENGSRTSLPIKRETRALSQSWAPDQGGAGSPLWNWDAMCDEDHLRDLSRLPFSRSNTAFLMASEPGATYHTTSDRESLRCSGFSRLLCDSLLFPAALTACTEEKVAANCNYTVDPESLNVQPEAMISEQQSSIGKEELQRIEDEEHSGLPFLRGLLADHLLHPTVWDPKDIS